MRTEQSRQECDYCERVTLHERTINQPNHILHLLLSFFTAGLWIPVWIWLSLNQTKGYWACTRCGEVPEGSGKSFVETMAIAVGICIGIAIAVLYLAMN